jgi:hypothetical protein
MAVCPNKGPVAQERPPLGTMRSEHVFVRSMQSFVWLSEDLDMDEDDYGVLLGAMMLDQAEANALLAMEKHRLDAVPHDFPPMGDARLDLDGRPHRNPDQTEVPCPHLHLYREGYDDRWAEPAGPPEFTNTADLYLSCQQFMAYCHVTLPPIIHPRLI